MVATAPRTAYRIVRHDPPIADDFKSLAQLGRPVPPNASPELRKAWKAAARQARANAARGRPLGAFVVELRIPPDAPVRADVARADGHVKLWAEPAVLLAAIVLPVKRVNEIA